MIAKRSPFFAPATFCSQAANARESSSSCRYVIDLPICTYATSFGNLEQLCSSSSFNERSREGSISAGTPGG